MSAATLYLHPSGLETTSGNSGDLDLSSYVELAIDINITANQGSSPTIQFSVERKGADGIYYAIWQSSTISTSTAQVSTSVGAGLTVSQSLGSAGRFRWGSIGGSSTPGFTFTASLQGK